MPALSPDTYDAVSGLLTVPAVLDQLNGTIYTNVTGRVAKILSVGAPGYLVAATTPNPAIVAAGKAAVSAVSVTGTRGYSGSVTLSCNVTGTGGVLPTCAFDPATLSVSGNAPASSTLTVTAPANSPNGQYRVTVRPAMPARWAR